MNYYHRIEDFLRDDDFIRYVIEGNTEHESRWEWYASNSCSSIRSAFTKAVHILQNLDNCNLLSEEEISLLKSRIFNTLRCTIN